MTSDPLPPLSALPIRRLSVYDLPACLDLAEDRGWAREEHKWRLLLTAGQGYGIDAPEDADAGNGEAAGNGDGGSGRSRSRSRSNGLIGAFVLTPYGTEYTCIGMVLVAQRYKRRGLGRRMMDHALAESGGATPFLSATPNGRVLYEQLGFDPVGSLTILTGNFKEGDDTTGATSEGTTVRPATAADLPAVLALDATVFGTDRTELLARLPSFADRFTIAQDVDGVLTGFAASWPAPGHTVIGPVVAEDLGTAQSLITDLGTHAENTVRFDVDDRHVELDGWLRAHGLDGDFRCTLMVHGAPDLPGDITRRFALYSLALG